MRQGKGDADTRGPEVSRTNLHTLSSEKAVAHCKVLYALACLMSPIAEPLQLFVGGL